MSGGFEQAHEHLEHTSHGHNHGTEPHTRRAAILIAIMAAALALTEFAAKDAQTDYLTNHIAASDTWSQYQGKSVRRIELVAEADLLTSLPNASDPAIQKRVTDARGNAERMASEPGDGMEQLVEKAHEQEHERDHAAHKTHILEIASGGLQIAIVLASISVVLTLPFFMASSLFLGIASAVYAMLGAFSVL
jgi:hypothetical protein